MTVTDLPTLAVHGPLEALAANVTVRPQELSVASPIAGASGFVRLQPDEGWGHLVDELSAYLYAHYYAGDPDLNDPAATDLLAVLGYRSSDPDFLRQLEAADPHTGYFRSGWRVVARDTHELRVRHDEVEMVIDPQRHLRGPERGAAVGDEVAVRFPPDSTQVSPGFYVTHADAGPAAGPLVRMYLTLHPAGAPAATAAVLGALAPLGLRYTYKVLHDPARYRRRDTAVIYLHRAHLASVLPAVVGARAQTPDGFRDDSPAFTRIVTGGVALADEPSVVQRPSGPTAHGRRRSFGQHRCDVLAAALSALPGSDDAAAPAPIRAALERAVRSAGLDPDRLYLDDPAGGEDHLTVTMETLL